MRDLKDRLIKLGYTNPELRDNLRPILAKLEQAKIANGDLANPRNMAVYREVMAISSGALASFFDIGSSYGEIDALHERLLDFLRNSQKTYTSHWEVMEDFKRTNKMAANVTGIQGLWDMGFRPVRSTGGGDWYGKRGVPYRLYTTTDRATRKPKMMIEKQVGGSWRNPTETVYSVVYEYGHEDYEDYERASKEIVRKMKDLMSKTASVYDRVAAENSVRTADECWELIREVEAQLKRSGVKVVESWDLDAVSHAWYFRLDVEVFSPRAGTSFSNSRGRWVQGWPATRENKAQMSKVRRAIKALERKLPKSVTITNIDAPGTIPEESHFGEKPERFYTGNEIEIRLVVDRYKTYEEMGRGSR